jgi:ribonuclease T1
MRRFVLFLSFLSLLSFTSCGNQGEPPHLPASSPGRSTLERENAIPQKVLEVFRHVRETGRPPEGYVGGRVWQNRERNLPLEGQYREYDVNPKLPGKNRGPERLVIDETSGNAWYTPDHYRTFILIK